jgi:hypothetical protein
MRKEELLMEQLAQRLERLESQLRRWRMMTMLATILLAFVLLTGAAYSQHNGIIQQPTTSLASRSFVLVGEDGATVYARLTTRNGTPVLNFYDEAGKVIWSAPPRATTKPADTN